VKPPKPRGRVSETSAVRENCTQSIKDGSSDQVLDAADPNRHPARIIGTTRVTLDYSPFEGGRRWSFAMQRSAPGWQKGPATPVV